MKKLTTLLFALMLTASVTFAQSNTAETRQSGSDNDATVEQTGADNYGGISQSGTNGTAIIEQVGDGNEAQDIRNGLPPVDEGAPAITGVQDFGDFNYGRVRQIGNNNEAMLEFTSTSDNNEVRIDQGVGGDRSFNSFAGVTVKDDNNTVDLDQRGTNQYAKIQIDRNLFGNEDNGKFNSVVASQEGSDNVIDRILINGHNNSVDVVQDGSSNSASVNISPGEELNSAFNVVDIMQNGVGHTASSTITGANNSATITQNN